MKTYKNHRKWKKIFLIFGCVCLVLVSFWWFENFTLKVTNKKICSSKVNSEIKIVHLTDLHGAEFGKNNKSLISKVINQKPDFVVITGDMYTFGKDHEKKTAINLMAELAKTVPVYFVPGENDRSEDYYNSLTEANVNVMNYKNKDITIRDTKISLYGIDNTYFSVNSDLNNEWNNPANDCLNILLSHTPNYFPFFAKWGANKTFAGDTHGGIMQFPFLGPLIYQDKGNWFPKFTFNHEIIYNDEGTVISKRKNV